MDPGSDVFAGRSAVAYCFQTLLAVADWAGTRRLDCQRRR